MTRTIAIALSLCLAAVSGWSCASAGGARASGGHNVLTAEEMVGVGNVSAYDAVRQLRPDFLRSRSVVTSTSPVATPIHVFLNGARTGEADALRLVRADEVKEIRFYEPQDANTRFGTGHNGGVIAVTLK